MKRFSHRPAATAAAVDWDAQWQSAWKAHPGNAWFRHQADALRAELAAGSGAADLLTLKTDAFEEACGFPTPSLTARGRWIMMDVSPRVLARAAARLAPQTAVGFCVSDVRHLALRPASFDAVFSHSTMDHFRDVADIEMALRELHAVLRPGGRLLITLDNPANPVLAMRRAVYRATGVVGGLIPFAMGRTLSRARLVGALERHGFRVVRSGYLLHTPRLLGLWTAEWAARAESAALGRGLGALFAATERLLHRLPTRRLTGHFVIADCVRVAAEAGAACGGLSPRTSVG